MWELSQGVAILLLKATIFNMQFLLIAFLFSYTRLHYLVLYKFPVCAEVLFLGN